MKSQNLTRTVTRSLLAITLIFMFYLTSYSQVVTPYFKAYNYMSAPGKKEAGFSLQKELSTDNGINWTIAGFSNCSKGSGGTDWAFMRLNKNGNLLKTILLGFSLNDSCFSHTVVNDYYAYKYALAGMFMNPNNRPGASLSLLNSSLGVGRTKMLTTPYSSIYRQVIGYYRDTSVILTGYADSGSTAKRNILAAWYKVNNNANTYKIWAYRYSTWTNSTEEAYSICNATTNSSPSFHVITGTTNYSNPQKKEVFVTKINAGGDPIWTKIYHLPYANNYAESRKIIQTPDNGYIVIGWTTALSSPYTDIWIFKIDMNGTPVWSRIYKGSNFNSQGNSIFFTSDGNLAFTGSYKYNAGTSNGIIGKINITNPSTIIGLKSFDHIGKDDMGFDIKEASDLNLVLTGVTNSTPSSGQDMFLLKSPFTGYFVTNCLNSFALQPYQTNFTSESIQLHKYAQSDMDISPVLRDTLPKVDTLCSQLTGTGENNSTIPDKYTLKQNYPNPFNPTTNIEFGIPEDGNVTLKIYDISGKEVASLINGYKQKGSYLVAFNASEISSGVYFYKLESGSFSQTRKMTVIK